MPTIEIVSLERKAPIASKKGKYPFQITQNSTLVSHRQLFNNYLKEQKGYILHLGNIACTKDGIWFASTLIDWKFSERDEAGGDSVKFKFNSDFREGVADLLFRALSLSPIKEAYLLTDYQFSPAQLNIVKLSNLQEFWSLHDEEGLFWNTLYEIHAK